MKFIELKDKNVAELQKMLHDKKSELFELRLKFKAMQELNPSRIKVIRKDIARINTALNAKKD